MRIAAGPTAPALSRTLKPFALLRAFSIIVITALMALALNLAVAGDVEAKKKKSSYKKAKVTKSYKKRRSVKRRVRKTRKARRARGNPKYAAYVIDAKTGKVLHSRNGQAPRYPASLTKMMTVYLMFEDIKAGRIKKSTRIKMTRHGARQVPSKLHMRPGQTLSVEQAILALVTKSANDVATAVAGNLEGSEAAFAKRMTRTARRLGMKNTTFKNANGLTARGQITTAADMARLGLALREHFPRMYRYFQTRTFRFGKRRYGNHNKLLGRVRGVDGIKTGYTRASGFNLVSSVSTGRRRIVAVVMGGRSGARRNAQMKRLIRAYLPKASRGAQRRLVARPKGASRKVVQANGGVDTQVIAKKAANSIANRIKTAHTPATTNSVTKKEVKKVKKTIKALNAETRPVPQLRRTIDADASVDRSTVSSIATPSGFHIQIAASDNRAKAVAMLERVQSRNRKLLGAREIYTQEVLKNGVTLYRARFTGFASKRSAERACKALKRQRLACLALAG
ncbi:MAG: D-alanyl-D-alanine carboxypeptidase [Pseudomonadota bacterium]